jgi:HK97 gp10 family phage protein
MDISFEIEGMDKLRDNLEKVAKSLGADAVEPILLEEAEKMADDARSRAPKGPTGNLKRSIVAKTLRRGRANAFGVNTGNESPAPAIVAIDYRIGPHAHLIEYGTVERISKKTGKSSGVVPAHPFFRPAWDAHQGHIIDDISSKLATIVEDSV